MSWLDRLLAALGIKSEKPETEDEADQTDAFRLHENTVGGLGFVTPEKRPRFRKTGKLLKLLSRRYKDPAIAAEVWETLSPRQKDVVAFICLGYSTQQIANRLLVSPGTVKSHLHCAAQEAGLEKREELCDLFDGWDFSAWEQTG